MPGFLAAIVLSLGVATAGWFVGTGFQEGRAADRFVTVKGVTERPVEADLAVWPLTVVASENDLAKAHAQLKSSVQAVTGFLTANGIASEQIHAQGFSVIDNDANPYGGGGPRQGNRFVIRQTLVIRSGDPGVVLAASGNVADLVASGVVLQGGNAYDAINPLFIFTRLNDLKPAMIAEATARAREAAEQFAKDSGARIGGIRRANQGVFQILPRDEIPGVGEAQQLHKVVRVVSTVEYFLED